MSRAWEAVWWEEVVEDTFPAHSFAPSRSLNRFHPEAPWGESGAWSSEAAAPPVGGPCFAGQTEIFKNDYANPPS